MMRVYTLERIAEEAVLHNRGTASGISAGLRKTTTNLSWDKLVEIWDEYRFTALPLRKRIRYSGLVVVQ
jgi:hypothetical protein